MGEKSAHPSTIEGASKKNSNHDQSDDIESKTENIDLVSSSSARDSYEGMLIQIKHSLCVVAETPYCITNPEISMDMYVQPEIAVTIEMMALSYPNDITSASTGVISNANQPFINASVPPAEEPELDLCLPLN